MERKIRVMRKGLNALMIAALTAGLWVNDGYGSVIAFLVVFAIAFLLRKKDKPEPDEMALQTELFSNYVASAVVVAFLIVMQARWSGGRIWENPYFQVMCVWLLSWGGFTLVLKKVWK